MSINNRTLPKNTTCLKTTIQHNNPVVTIVKPTVTTIVKPTVTTIQKPVTNNTNLVKPLIKPNLKINITWTSFPNYIIGHTTKEMPNFTNSKIAAFDLDDTLIRVKSGSKFGNDENDWAIFDDSIIPKLKKLVADNYKLVIVTNQKGISTKKTDPVMWKNKVSNFVNFLDLNFTILCCTGDDCYRKPGTKLWDTYIKAYDKDKSFYCGDAGGLPVRTVNKIKLKKDFADTDLKFALNLKVKFIHRDEFVYDVTNTSQYNVNYPNVKSYCINPSNKQYDKLSDRLSDRLFCEFQNPSKQEMVILCGFPASGKSNFAQTILDSTCEYIVINQDTLKTPAKCIAATEEAISEIKSVIIDNTSISKDKRAVYINIAKKHNLPVRCLLFTCPIELCKHNSYYRNFATNGEVNVIPDIAYNIMKSKYEKPDVSEGFTNVEEVGFCFDDEQNIDNYCKYYY